MSKSINHFKIFIARQTKYTNRYQGSINYLILMTLENSSLCSKRMKSRIPKFSDCYINNVLDSRGFSAVVCGYTVYSSRGNILYKKEKK